MTDRDIGRYRNGELLEAHRETARSLLEDIIEAADPGLHRVGYETQENEFLYAVAFKIPSDAMQ